MSSCHPNWRDLAACRGMPARLFYPQRNEPTESAKAVCASCPVKAECLDAAIDEPELFGIWGGLSTKQRNRVRLTVDVEGVAS